MYDLSDTTFISFEINKDREFSNLLYIIGFCTSDFIRGVFILL
jgi:hypothetical protein